MLYVWEIRERSLFAGRGAPSISASCASREVTVCNQYLPPLCIWLSGFVSSARNGLTWA